MKKAIVLMALIGVIAFYSSALCEERTIGLGITLVEGDGFSIILEALKQTNTILFERHDYVFCKLWFYQVDLAKSESVIISGSNINYQIRLKEINFEQKKATFEVIKKHF